MALMTWEQKFSVGITGIDDQHKKLIGLLNDLHEAMITGKSKEKMGEILNGLIVYTKTHFDFEEVLMTKHGYPDLAAHKVEHATLTAKVLEFQSQFKSGQAAMSVNVMAFLKDWLVNHIQGTDKKYGPFLNSKGLS